MSKIFIIFLIFALPSPLPSPVYNRALCHVLLSTGKIAKSFRHVYISASIEMKAKYKVVALWNDTDVCKPGALIGCRIVVVSFALGVEKGLRRDKCRLVKMLCLFRGKIGKTGKYRGNGKTRNKTKNRGALVPSNLNFIKKMSGLYQTRERLALYPSEATTIFHLLATSGFFGTTIELN